MLAALTILVIWITSSPFPDGPGMNTTAALVLDYRKNLLAVLVTTFGAWVGAGAAFYFGRENLKDATKSLLEAQGVTGKERLAAKRSRTSPLTRSTSRSPRPRRSGKSSST